MVCDKTNELRQKEADLVAAETEIHALKQQVEQFESHVGYLKSCQEKTTHENTDIQGRIDCESSKNVELGSIIKDIETKIKAKVDQVNFLTSTIECARATNCTSLNDNGNLQAEIDGMSQHIGVISIQNKELSHELDTFVSANEAMRLQLDRRTRVSSIMEKNDHTIAHSQAYVAEAVRVAKEISRSPIRGCYTTVPVAHGPPLTRVDRSLERVQGPCPPGTYPA
jgi:regulator of replication initiation timing